MNRVIRFLKDWALPVSMIVGVAAYFLFVALPFGPRAHALANRAVGIIQPALLFCMLFISFCKVDPGKIRLRRWHLWLALIQSGSFILMALIIHFCHCPENIRILIESAMICLICPTATAAVVVTDKLGGNMAAIVTYTMIANIMTAVVASLFIPMINPGVEITFVKAFSTMIAKVFSLLVVPLILAVLVRYLLPGLHRQVLKTKDLAFYLWTVGLALALTVTTRSIVHTTVPAVFIVGIGLVSLLCCLLQFRAGWSIGRHYHDQITAGQALGQKNTIFIIWLAYTFMNPVTAVAGGMYSIWHNLINSWQLYKKRHA
ncbi:MAG: transporter [Bacteroidales bacterium]|nr:transporter [Bacteroidales bacterium]